MKKVDSEDSTTMAALERYRSKGSDLSQPMKIDFFVATPTQEAAETVARQATSLGFATRVEATDATESWTATNLALTRAEACGGALAWSQVVE